MTTSSDNIVALVGLPISICCLIFLCIRLVYYEFTRKRQFSRRLVLHLFIATLASSANFLGQSAWVAAGHGADENHTNCVVQGFLLMYTALVVNAWAVVIAINIFLNVKYQKDLSNHELLISFICWIGPVVTPSITAGLFTFRPGPPKVWCLPTASQIPNPYFPVTFALFHVFYALACLIIIVLYVWVIIILYIQSKKLEKSKVRGSTLRVLSYPIIHLVLYCFRMLATSYAAFHPVSSSLNTCQVLSICLEGVFNALGYGLRRTTVIQFKSFWNTYVLAQRSIQMDESPSTPSSEKV